VTPADRVADGAADSVERVADTHPKSARGEQTRAAIVAAALELFRERGYEKTTMRAVADAAGVSIGNAYYYVPSKEHLIQAFYDRTQEEHAAAVRPVLAGGTGFAARLSGVLEAYVDVAEPYHEFAGKFFRIAADPQSPLSPFSAESAPARAASTAIFAETVAGSDLKVPAAVRAELPGLLWLLHMGVVLFWVHDTSENRSRTRALIRQAAPLVDRLVRLTRLPGMRGVTDDLVRLVRSVAGSPK
jgi:AcrR family transcriptional regulator